MPRFLSKFAILNARELGFLAFRNPRAKKGGTLLRFMRINTVHPMRLQNIAWLSDELLGMMLTDFTLMLSAHLMPATYCGSIKEKLQWTPAISTQSVLGEGDRKLQPRKRYQKHTWAGS